MGTFRSFGLLFAITAAAAVPPSVVAEIARRGHAPLLVEIAKSGDSDIFNTFRAGLHGDCRVLSTWVPASVVHIDATSACLSRLKASPSVAEVELAPAAFVAAAAGSLPLPRYQRAAILGRGIDNAKTGIREVFRKEACFCSTGNDGCCPGGVSQQFGESAASAPRTAGPSTENTAFLAARPGHSTIIDGLNLELISIRIADSGGTHVSIASAIDALDWLVREDPLPGAVVLSFESEEVYCGPCEGKNIANRALATYLNLLRSRGVRLFAPDLGFRVRGAPACLPGVESFPASVPLPSLSADFKPLGAIAGSIASIERFASPFAPPEGWAAAEDLPPSVYRVQLAASTTPYGMDGRTISTLFSFSSFGITSLFQNVRGSVYYLKRGESFIYVLHAPQASSCPIPELANDIRHPLSDRNALK